MAEIKKSGAEYIGYEYKRKEVMREYASLYLDSYPCFGWEEDPNKTAQEGTYQNGTVSLYFRRDRKLCNKTELTRLQRNFDSCITEIERLEHSKKRAATIVALLIGMAGCAFMAGSVFAVTARPPLIFLCIVLAIPGFCGWIAPYFTYRTLARKKTEQVSILIEDKMEEIYSVCEKGKELLF